MITGAGMISSNWQNDISKEEYLIHHKQLNAYGPSTSTTSFEKYNNEANKNYIINKKYVINLKTEN